MSLSSPFWGTQGSAPVFCEPSTIWVSEILHLRADPKRTQCSSLPWSHTHTHTSISLFHTHTHTHTHRFHSFTHTHTHTHTHIDFTLSHTHTHTYTHTSISLFPPEQSSEEKWKTILSSVNSARFLATNLQFSPQLQGPHSFLKGQVEQNLEKKISKNDIHCYVFSCSNILLLLYPKSRLSWHFKCISYLINRGINTKVLLILKGIIE